MPVVLDNGRIVVGVLPDYGARVVSFVDRESGREWVDQGTPSRNVGETATYGRAEATGWDECFPTISPWDGTATVWKRPLRDHGDLWGRQWQVTEQRSTALDTAMMTAEFRFRRRLELDGATLRAHYEVENRTSSEMPYLWALHGLLAVSPQDRIVLPGVSEMAATYLTLDGQILHEDQVPWPVSQALPFALDQVQPADRNFAGKFYGHGIAGRRASIGHGQQWLTISWDEAIDDLGLWLNYGAWPEPPGTYHVALEPTTASVDHLGEALDAGRARWLQPGATDTWTITLTLSKDAA
jgi:galactose mutarotase-like enzyme